MKRMSDILFYAFSSIAFILGIIVLAASVAQAIKFLNE